MWEEGEWILVNILANLNPEQQQAVITIDGPVLILAGAGSGKTRVLTYRYAYLVEEIGIEPEQILAITFTNKAAGEMKERICQLVQNIPSRRMWISTFHSFCARLLRMEIEKLGYTRSFVVYDTNDQIALIKEVIRELNLDDRYFRPRAVLSTISNAKNQLIDAEAYQVLAADYYQEKVSLIYNKYQDKLKKNNALDFDDLLLLTVKLLEDFPQTASYYQNKFRYIMVDEYQDTNHAQYNLVKILAAAHRNLCVVGDDDQSIYRFRGADINNILDFERDYPEATVIKLEQNYRSTQAILDLANCLVQNNLGRKDKKLWTKNPKGELPFVFQAPNEQGEAQFIVKEIERLRREKGYSYNNFAVLYRTNAQSRVIEEAMLKAGIPYQMVGGIRFYERKEIKDLLAYLRLINNPFDDVSFKRIINVPKRGIGKTTLEKLEDLAGELNTSLLLALKDIENSQLFSAKTGKKLSTFRSMLEDLIELKESLPVVGLVNEVIEKIGYIEDLIQEGTEEAKSRIENIKEFISVALEFEQQSGQNSLDEFLTWISLVSDVDNWEEEKVGVVLMTLHSAKGLEFPVVFIAGMEEGIFPHSRALEDEEELEEERRLCYVGVTRAKEYLYLLMAQSRMLYGTVFYNTPSRFLLELPKSKISGMTSLPASRFKNKYDRYDWDYDRFYDDF
jgi:DNA helicase-2/ATP-dependent DNA helicase PcrA